MRAAALFMATALLAPGVQATDLGTLGPTYEITEPHLLQMIMERLREKERSGELARITQQARDRSTALVRHPPALTNVRATQAPRTFYVDPTYTLERNLLGAQGELLFAAGTQANPLDIVSLSRHLLFFDARDPRQVRQARALVAHYETRVKPILTGGSFLDLMARWRIPVYYDQHGRLTQRLGITQVPALVSQEGRRLRIDELEIAR